MKKKTIFLEQVIIFVLMLIFLLRVSPMIPFDGDDWYFIGAMRLPIPLWGAWNPTRVLPEILDPLCGYIAAFCIYPFSHNYVWSLTFVSALVFDIFIVILMLNFYKLIRKKLGLNVNLAMLGEAFFFLSFFMLFKHFTQSSYSLFWTVDQACVFFYLIPGFLNASVIVYMEQFDNFNKYFNGLSYLRQGLMLLLLYFTVFSCSQLTIIIAIYSFLKIIQIYIDYYKKTSQLKLKSYLKEVWLYFLILVGWLVSVVFDLNGGRANSVTSVGITQPLRQFISLLGHTNKVYMIFSVGLIIFVFAFLIKSHIKNTVKEKEVFKLLCIIFISLIVAFIYLMIAYIKAGSEYAARPDAMWPVFFFFTLGTSVSFCYVISKFRRIQLIIPLLICLMTILSFSFNYLPISPSNSAGHNYQTEVKVDNYIINQIIKADREGKATVTVRVPLNNVNANSKNTGSNWPHPYSMASYLQNTLYTHGITRSRIQIKFNPDEKVNKTFYENKTREQAFFSVE